MSERVAAAAAPWIAAAFLLMLVWIIGAAWAGWGFNGASLATIVLVLIGGLRALVVASRREWVSDDRE